MDSRNASVNPCPEPHRTPDPTPRTPEFSEGDGKTRLVRRYATRVTVVLMILCPALFFLGLWVSDIRADQLFRLPDVFHPAKDVCLRLGWQRVSGKEDLVQVCSEWIHLADPSGETHSLTRETTIREGADGKLYFDYGSLTDWRLFAYVGLVVAILAFGWFVRRYLVTRYRLRLEAAARQASIMHWS
ncbi:MAG: hypothetical protein NW703_05840 [Nitrospiraceae bacterium]